MKILYNNTSVNKINNGDLIISLKLYTDILEQETNRVEKL